jgi:hypothetical protein
VDDFVKIIVLDNEFEAQLVDSILKERDIPHRMRSYHDTAYDGLFQAQKGWGHVDATEGFAGEIRNIVHELREKAGKERMREMDE